MNNMHFALCVNDGYVPYICVTIKSILENHKSHRVTIHVLSNYISKKRRKLLKEVMTGYDYVTLQIHIVDDSILRGLKDTWSIYTWYRVLLPKVLSDNVHRVLYLDADTLVDGDVSELFRIDMADKAIAGAIDILSFDPKTFERCMYEEEKKYVCAGVMLMNLDYWRENALTDKVIAWGREHDTRIKFPDQDTINYLCRDHKIILPMRYGILGVYFSKEVFYKKPYFDELIECLTSPAIVHYAAQAPWKIELAYHPFQKEWEKYNAMLRHPAKRVYITKGWDFVKMRVWNILHPSLKRKIITKNDILKQIVQHDS